jgi:hypothetical protein
LWAIAFAIDPSIDLSAKSSTFPEGEKDDWWKALDCEEGVRSFLCGLWFFGIVQHACNMVPRHDVPWSMAVPQQHAALELFDQPGAAVHPALCAIVP